MIPNIEGKVNYIQHTLRAKKHILDLVKIVVKNGYAFSKVTFWVSFHFLGPSLTRKASFADNARFWRGYSKNRMCQQSSEESENVEMSEKERSPKRLPGFVRRLQEGLSLC